MRQAHPTGRDAMVAAQIERRGVRDARVLEAMRRVPRELFVDETDVGRAHEDSALAIGCGQTISQPYIVAVMAEAACIEPGARVLDVGTGSGYGAAVLARLADRVVSVERHAPLAEAAREKLARAGIDNVEVHVGDGTRGWPTAAPFDAIVVAAAAERVPEALKEQLKPSGRLVMPVGKGVGHWGSQRLMVFTRKDGDLVDAEDLGPVAFVPLVPERAMERSS